jgi:hypothetical protein
MNLENPENVKCGRCRCYRSEESFFNNKGRRLKTCQNCRDIDTRSREKYKCEHNRRKEFCKECGGAYICNHNRRKSSCKECGGSQICNHNRIKSVCKECGGSQICEHNRRRSKCKECGGASICEHGRQRNTCKECGGSQICNHNRLRNQCKECGGASICNHNRIRNQCKECSDPIKLTIKNMICGAKANDKKYNRYDAVNFVDYCFVENLLDDYKCCYYEDCKKELQIMKYNNSLATLERINNNIGHIKSNCVICCLECNRKVKSNETTC